MRAYCLALATGLALLHGGCSLFVDTSGLDTLTDASRDAAGDATRDVARDVTQDVTRDVTGDFRRDVTLTDAGKETSPPDSPADAGVDGDSGGGGDGPLTCPSGRGPAMINVATFCIDSTEVTNAQYEAFLKSIPDPTKQSAVCSWNATFVPGMAWPYATGRDDYPVVWVDWCDAQAFCTWAGKRMCGAIGGGSFKMSDYANPSVDQHYYACSQGAASVYPYGNTWGPTTCNGVNAGFGSTVPVGSLTGCVGGFPGLYDMVGNVEEWQDSCDGTLGMSDNCVDGTGAFDYPGGDGGPDGTRCDFLDTDYRAAQYQDVGIRCCAP